MQTREGHGQAARQTVSFHVMSKFLAHRRSIIVLAILLAGLILRLAIAPLGAHPGDFPSLTGWANAIRVHSLISIYQGSDANYPPLAMAVLAGSAWLHSVLAPGDLTGPLWAILLKLPIILADLGIAWLVWRASLPRGGSLWLLAAMVFNPALFYLSAWWGQYESIYMLGALAALLAARDGRFFRAGLWLGLGMMVKLQAAVIAPVLALVALQGGANCSTIMRRLAGLAGGCTLPLIVCLGPYAATGQLDLVLLRLIALVSSPGWLTVNALNIWYAGTLGAGSWRFDAPLLIPDSTPVFLGLSAHTLGLILLGVWVVGILWLFLHRPSTAAAGSSSLWAGALLFMGVFLLPTQVHERYAFGAVVLMGAAAACDIQSGVSPRTSTLFFTLITTLHMLNLLWAAPFDLALIGWFSGSLAWGMAISLVQIGVGVWVVIAYRVRQAT